MSSSPTQQGECHSFLISTSRSNCNHVTWKNAQVEDNQEEEYEDDDEEEDTSINSDEDYYYPDNRTTAQEKEEESAEPYSLQYRYDMLKLEHESLLETMEKYEDKCKAQDNKIDFLVAQLGKAWKENERLNRLLGKETEKNQKAIVNGVVETTGAHCRSDAEENGMEQSENGDPLKIFPEEVWIMIFDMIHEPEDLESCYKSCPTFHNLLEDKKWIILLPDVFKLVDSKVQFSTTDILNCRLVSSVWKKIADSTLQLRDYRYNFHYLNHHEFNRSEKFSYTFDDSTALKVYKNGLEYLETLVGELNSDFYSGSDISPTFDRSTWSAFPSRHVIIQDEDIQIVRHNMDMRIYRDPTISLLKKVGDHIWYLDIWINLSLTICDWYNLLLDWLHCTPNLKVLQFSYPYDNNTDKSLEKLVTSRPFPLLKNLVMLTVENVPMTIINSALQANKHVEMLQILRPDLEKDFDFGRNLTLGPHLLNQLQNLKKISLTINTEQEFEQFESLTWPIIETINVKFNGIFKHWEKIFSILNRFQGSLTTLNLRLPRRLTPFFVWNENKTENMHKNMMLHLPKLKRLRLSFVDHTPIDFILPMSSLEDLYLHVDHMDYDKPSRRTKVSVVNGQIINFNQFYECLAMSNILDALPSLKEVYVAVRDINFGFPTCRRYNYNRMDTAGVFNVYCLVF